MFYKSLTASHKALFITWLADHMIMVPCHACHITITFTLPLFELKFMSYFEIFLVHLGSVVNNFNPFESFTYFNLLD